MGDTPLLDAELLLAHCLHTTRAHLLAHPEYHPSSAQVACFAALMVRRLRGEPLAYLVGQREFYGFGLLVDARVLVPRPETEHLVEQALAAAARCSPPHGAPLTLVDVGTGSGAIAIALAHHLPAARLLATDLSAEALEVAAANLARHSLHQRVTLLHGDLLEPLRGAGLAAGQIDLLVSNPPYTVLADIDAGVRAHEPRLALDGGADGLDCYRRLLPEAAAWLRRGGSLLLEIGAAQHTAVAALARAAFPAAQITIARDLAGWPRVVRVDTKSG